MPRGESFFRNHVRTQRKPVGGGGGLPALSLVKISSRMRKAREYANCNVPG